MKWRQRLMSLLEGLCVASLVFFLVQYGLIKVLDRQFFPRMPTFDEPAHRLDGYQLAWLFFAYSRRMEFAAGVLELVCAALLFFRRTRNLGALLATGLLGYLVLLNLDYAIGALVRSSAMFAMALLIVLIRFLQFKAFFWDHAAPPQPPQDLWPPWARTIGRSAVVVVLGLGLYQYSLSRDVLAPHLQPAEVYGRYRLQSVAGAGEEHLPWVAGAIVYLDHRGDAGVRQGDSLRLGAYRIDPDLRSIEITLYNTGSEYLHQLHRSDGREADRVCVPENAVSHVRGRYEFSSSAELIVRAEQPAGLVLRLSRDELHWPQKHWYLHLVQSPVDPRGSGGDPVANRGPPGDRALVAAHAVSTTPSASRAHSARAASTGGDRARGDRAFLDKCRGRRARRPGRSRTA